MRNKYTKNSSTNLFLITLLSIIIMFAAIIIIITPTVPTNFLQSKSLERITNSDAFTNIFLFMLGEEIPQFKSSIGNELKAPSLSNIAFEAVTGISNEDISTLITKEIPGLDLASTKIHIAGEGSDYSNLPQESPPPNFDDLLKEEDSNNDKPPDSKKGTEKNNGTDNSNNPSVFIYHSHSWEGYLPLIDDENVKPSDSSSTDNNKNVVLVGSMLTDKLKADGITTVHNKINAAKALSDKGWDYYNSYTLSREQVETVASQNERIEYFIDIHRDSARKESTTIDINGKSYAKLYFVVGEAHKKYEENLKFASEIHEKLEEKYPGLSKGVYLKSKSEGNGVYNQDISSKSLLVEVGGIDNDKKELNNTVDAFADIFKEVYEGAIKVDAQ